MENELKRPLTPEQEKFCLAYTSRGEHARNATLSYAYAYDYVIPKRENGTNDTASSEYRTCQACASALLLSPKVSARIKEIYLDLFTDDHIDARLNEIITNGQESNSVQAIKIANDLKQRITKRIDITSANRPLGGLSDDELKALVD